MNSHDIFAPLRAELTEAEAEYGRYMIGPTPMARSVHDIPLVDRVITARAALRKAEEEAKRPRLASVGEIQSRATSYGMRDRDEAMVRAVREDMRALIERLPTVRIEKEAHVFTTNCVALSDIEALVREAQP